MIVHLEREYEMEVGHHLTAGVPDGHKCRRQHGHRYVLTVEVSGELDTDGMLIEYADLDAVIKPLVAKVDHHDLNTLRERCSTAIAEAVSCNPTVERLVCWFVDRLALVASARQAAPLTLQRVSIREDSRSKALWVRPTPT